MRANSVQRNARCWNSTGVGHGPRHYSADQEDAKTVAKNFNGFNVADGFHLTSNMLKCEKDVLTYNLPNPNIYLLERQCDRLRKEEEAVHIVLRAARDYQSTWTIEP